MSRSSAPHARSHRASATGQTRRTILQGAAAATMAAVMVPAGATSALAAADEDFAAVSKILTGRSNLDGDFRRALLDTFAKLDPTFATRLGALRRLIEPLETQPEALRAATAAAGPDLAALQAQILQGWYLGVVGDGPNAICVTYTQALAHVAVSDVLRPPSYAYGEYGSWQGRPV